MPDTTCHLSISLDGFVAGPDQSQDNPLWKGGREAHPWYLGDERANDADATAEGWLMRPRGAYVMGRNMFGPIRGEWDGDWDGWWASSRPTTRRPSCSPTTPASRRRLDRPPGARRRRDRRIHARRRPILFGSGERLFDGVESYDFEPAEVLHSPLATHIRYRRAS